MPVNYSPYWFLVVLLGVGIGFCLAPLALAWLWARRTPPPPPGPTHDAPYECGLPSAGVTAPRFKSEYYLYGLLFLVFDVEVIFLLPFAVYFSDVAPGGFIAVLVFMLLLGEGLAWAWVKGLLTWK
jgi:NADH:ubiquinone oxidoreductase subunit 3 (subunit A)